MSNNFTNAVDFGFSPDATGMENTAALQRAVDQTGTIVVAKPGTYKIADTVFIGSNTSLIFGNNVILQKVEEQGPFTHVFLNKGALTKTYDHHISIEGLHIEVNKVDILNWKVYGLRGQIAFFYIKDLRINRFRCFDMEPCQYCVHVCTFEDFIIDDAIIKGKKDGVHLGRGKRFTIRNCVFETFDDAVALNAHDYSSGNPELGWIEDGVVEKCYDLNGEATGFFCRILAGAWKDWEAGMEIQQSDTVVANGRLYRVQNEPDGTIYTTKTQPSHESGSVNLDGINWGVIQEDITYTCGVRNVTFRDIFLEKPRTAFSIHFDHGKYSRSYYPGSEIPEQKQLVFDNVRVLHDKELPFLSTKTPVDAVTICNSSFQNNRIEFTGNFDLNHPKTSVNIIGCTFNHPGNFILLQNNIENKEIVLKTAGNIATDDEFSAQITSGNGNISVISDLPGLN